MCIVEAVTREIPWADCSSDELVSDRKLRWTPESTFDEALEPKCIPEGGAKALVWRMCCQDSVKRTSLASVVVELERLATDEDFYLELAPGVRSTEKMWRAMEKDIEGCDNNFYHDVFDEIKMVWNQLQVARYPVSVYRHLVALIRGFRGMIAVSSERSLVLKLPASGDTSSSTVALRLQLRSLWDALGETADGAREREARWDRFGWPRFEVIVCEASMTYLLVGEVKTQTEQSTLQASLKAELDQPFKYTRDELYLLTNAFWRISSCDDTEKLLQRTPQSFIPWYEIVIDEWHCLSNEGVYRAKWLNADVVVKRVAVPGLDGHSTQSDTNFHQRHKTLETFWRFTEISHPHVIRLFGACHFGQPFFVWEYATNGTLVSYLREHPDQLWPKLHEAALGLQYLHAREVVVGDLKGDSIVVGSDLKAKVADFGYSSLRVVSDDTHTRIRGAWQWVAPECLVEDAPPPTFASDIYSLGMCIVEALRVRSGKDLHHSLPWGMLPQAIGNYHATHGRLPSRPLCSETEWELVNQMCTLEPTKRLRITEVVDELSKLARRQHNDVFPVAVSLELGSVPQVAATAQRLLAHLQHHTEREELVSVLRLYVALWNRLEQIHVQIGIKFRADTRAAFCSIIGEAEAATAQLQNSTISALSLAVLALQYYAFERRLHKVEDGDTDLMWAARNGRFEVVRALIEGGTDVNAQDDAGQTALMAAAAHDHVEMVKYMLKHGSSLTTTDHAGNSVLMIAAGKGHVEVCQYLIKKLGTDINAQNEYGYSALMRAAANGHLQAVQCLASQRGVDVNSVNKFGHTALMMATLGGATAIVLYLAANFRPYFRSKTKDGETLLMMAASAGHYELFKYLVEQKRADINDKSDSGDTALIRAAESGCTTIVQFLAARRVDLNAQNAGGNTALMQATRYGHADVVRSLLEQRGVDVTARNQRGETAIRIAVDHGYQEIRRMLTPFLPHLPEQRAGGGQPSDQPLRSSISPSEVEFVRFCRSGNIGGEFRAKWLDADAVVKLFVPDASSSTFEDEVRLWQQLRHPNVMKMYGACNASPNLQFFVCEYISNGPLIERVELASMQKPTVWKFLHEAALGLKYLHERGAVHGDLRCSNILIGSDGLAKLSNFGLSGPMERSDRDSSDVMGSMRWLSPDVLEGNPPSIASDIYSLGMCVLEATTREQPWGCESEQAAWKYKMRWAPETNSYSFSEPDCPPRDARKLVWRMCCKTEARRVNLSFVVDELERLAIAERSSYSHPEHEPASGFTCNDMWLDVQAHMDKCNDDKYRQVFDKLNAVYERWQESGSRDDPTVLGQFLTFLTEFYRAITMSPEQVSIMLLSSSCVTVTSMNSFHWRMESMLTVLSDSVDSTKMKKDRWQQQRREQLELFLSGVEDTELLLERLKSPEERAVFLKTLKAEMEDPQSQYTPEQLAAVKKAYAGVASTLEGEDLSKRIPDWFIPRFELFVDGWKCLGSGGFGCVYRAKWLGSDVVAKLLGSDSEAELFFAPKAQACQSSLSTLLDLSRTRSAMDSTERGETIAMFRHEVGIWFGFNHPHVVRLFGACHVGTPFFVCEYATNGTLVTYLETHPDELWLKLHEAALGVQYLHARKVVHGDLKGNNIVVGSDKKAKVTDFGLSSVAGNEAKPPVSGAWHWVAPECLPEDKKEPHSADKRPTFESDIYSLGMCIVEALHVVENAERVKSGKEPQPCLPWRGLDNFLVRYHATKGGLPSQPTVCNDEQWELVKEMCVFNPKVRAKISTVVDRLAQLANPQQAGGAAVCSKLVPLDQICAREPPQTSSRRAFGWLRRRLQSFSCIPSLKSGVDSSCVAEMPEREDPKAVPEVIADARGLLGRLQSGVQVQRNSVLTLFTSLWDRIEELREKSTISLGKSATIRSRRWLLKQLQLRQCSSGRRII